MILIINNHSPYVSKIQKILKDNKTSCIIKDQKSPLTDINKRKIKGVILSGGGPDLDKKIDLDKLRADLIALLEFNVPTLGICEGHQIIAEIFGGEVESLKKPIERVNKIEIIKKEAIFSKLPKEIEMEESHGRYVRKIPNDFVLAASSKKDKFESLFHKTKPIFTVQFHPESSGPLGEKIITNFLDICKAR